MADCFDTDGWDEHQLPLGYFGKNKTNDPVAHVFWGEHSYTSIPHLVQLWDSGKNGPGIGKISYDAVIAIDSTSDKCLIILEGSPEFSIEKWDISGSPLFTGLYVSGQGDINSKFNNPIDVTADPDNYVYVLDILSNGQPKIKIFKPDFQCLGGVGNSTSIPGTPIAIDWDDFGNAAHVLHSNGVSVFYK
jgi:hypothetical protein